MEKHISDKELIRYQLGEIAAAGKRRVDEHVAHCEQCNRSLLLLKDIAAPSITGPAIPDATVHNRIMAFYDASSVPVKKEGVPAWRRLSPLLKPVPAALMSAGAAAIVLISLVLGGAFDDHDSLRVLGVRGTVTADSREIARGMKIVKGTKLEVGKNSHLAMGSDRSMKLQAGAGTFLDVIKSGIDKKSGKVSYDFSIHQGTICAHLDAARNHEYNIKTPHATIQSRGAKMLVVVGSTGTRVLVKKGSAHVVPATDDTPVQIDEGYQYTIADNISIDDNTEAFGEVIPCDDNPLQESIR